MQKILDIMIFSAYGFAHSFQICSNLWFFMKLHFYKNIFIDIENLTHKTGNYKQFDVFVTMLQSGLLKVMLLNWGIR